MNDLYFWLLQFWPKRIEEPEQIQKHRLPLRQILGNGNLQWTIRSEWDLKVWLCLNHLKITQMWFLKVWTFFTSTFNHHHHHHLTDSSFLTDIDFQLSSVLVQPRLNGSILWLSDMVHRQQISEIATQGWILGDFAQGTGVAIHRWRYRSYIFHWIGLREIFTGNHVFYHEDHGGFL